jgi:hypothetical protein
MASVNDWSDKWEIQLFRLTFFASNGTEYNLKPDQEEGYEVAFKAFFGHTPTDSARKRTHHPSLRLSSNGPLQHVMEIQSTRMDAVTISRHGNLRVETVESPVIGKGWNSSLDELTQYVRNARLLYEQTKVGRIALGLSLCNFCSEGEGPSLVRAYLGTLPSACQTSSDLHVQMNLGGQLRAHSTRKVNRLIAFTSVNVQDHVIQSGMAQGGVAAVLGAISKPRHAIQLTFDLNTVPDLSAQLTPVEVHAILSDFLSYADQFRKEGVRP